MKRWCDYLLFDDVKYKYYTSSLPNLDSNYIGKVYFLHTQKKRKKEKKKKVQHGRGGNLQTAISRKVPRPVVTLRIHMLDK